MATYDMRFEGYLLKRHPSKLIFPFESYSVELSKALAETAPLMVKI